MDIGVAIFASVVLILLVSNKPFRNFCAWIMIFSLILLIVTGGWSAVHEAWTEHVAKQKAYAECKQRIADAHEFDFGFCGQP